MRLRQTATTTLIVLAMPIILLLSLQVSEVPSPISLNTRFKARTNIARNCEELTSFRTRDFKSRDRQKWPMTIVKALGLFALETLLFLR